MMTAGACEKQALAASILQVRISGSLRSSYRRYSFTTSISS